MNTWIVEKGSRTRNEEGRVLIMVLFYCFSGGLRASVWTDAAQSTVMLLGMGVMVWITVSQQGGIQPSLEALDAVSATYMNWFPTELAFGSLGPLLFVIVLALLIALFSNETVFWLVLHAWSGLGAAFAPLLIVYTLGRQPPQWLVIAMIVTGPVVVLLYQLLDGRIVNTVYEILPGMVAGSLVYLAGAMMVKRHQGREAMKPD